MQPIRIHEDNAVAIEAALHKANGAALTHTFNCYSDIEAEADLASSRLGELGLPVKLWKGARFRTWSGGRVAKSYKYSRQATMVTLERRATGWFLVDVQQTAVWEKPPEPQLCVTRYQADEAQRRFAERYTIL